MSYGTSWSSGEFWELQCTEPQLSPLGQSLSFLTSMVLRSFGFDVHFGNMSMFLLIYLLGFGAIHDTFDYQALNSKRDDKKRLVSVGSEGSGTAPDKAVVKGVEGFWGSSCPSEQVWVRVLQIPPFGGCLHDFAVPTHHLYQH